MKTWLMVLLVTGIPPLLAFQVADAAQERGNNASRVIVFDGPAEARFAAAEVSEDRPWLGVSVGEVPEPLAAQLALEGEGVVVRNVVKDSPADEAGFEAYDVILAIDGEPVSADVQKAISLIRDRQPGDNLNFLVLRHGEEVELQATLGSFADAPRRGFIWKFDTAADAEVEEQIHTRGRMLMRDEEGKWTLEDLGELHKLDRLPERIRMALPKGGKRSVRVSVENGKRKVHVRVERDENVIVVEQENDGPITVTRVDAAGGEATSTYQTPEDLKAADEEAYEVYQDTQNVHTFRLRMDGPGAAGRMDLDLELDGLLRLDPNRWSEHLGEWEQHLHEGLAEAREAHEKAMQTLEQLKAEGKFPDELDLRAFPRLLFRHHDGGPPLGFSLEGTRKPRHTFELRTDGTIEVRIRKGDAELVQLFGDENDLARRDPELYEKYLDLLSAGEEE